MADEIKTSELLKHVQKEKIISSPFGLFWKEFVLYLHKHLKQMLLK